MLVGAEDNPYVTVLAEKLISTFCRIGFMVHEQPYSMNAYRKYVPHHF